ncbi:UNVERIFIED_CONTAM: hypothetical protein GTU68_021265 [Idotea baltica]|nr:hypothetical protein [Idotea baltica]
MTEFTVSEIAAAIGAEVIGDDKLIIKAIAPLSDASTGDITFISSPKFLSAVESSSASALITSPKFKIAHYAGVQLQHPNPYLAYAKAVQFMHPEVKIAEGVHPSAVVDDSVILGEDVRVAANAVVDAGTVLGDRVQICAGAVVGPNCHLGDDTCLKPNVTLYHGVRIGKRTTIHSGTVIGSDGFGYAPDAGVWHKIPQVGSVQIGDRNLIRENVTINRGTVQDIAKTVIGNDNWIMAYVHIAHDCVVGNNITFANNATLAGHVTIHDYAILGGFTLVHQFCNIGKYAFTGMGSALSKDIPPYVMAYGTPAVPRGINREGLKRNNFSAAEVANIKECYRLLYRKDLQFQEAISAMQSDLGEGPEVQRMIDFCKASKRGIIR